MAYFLKFPHRQINISENARREPKSDDCLLIDAYGHQQCANKMFLINLIAVFVRKRIKLK